MLRLYCNGKKDYCDNHSCCDESCNFYDGSGSTFVKQQTNADRIRAMNDAELAHFLYCYRPDFPMAWLENWLRRPAEQKTATGKEE